MTPVTFPKHLNHHSNMNRQVAYIVLYSPIPPVVSLSSQTALSYSCCGSSDAVAIILNVFKWFCACISMHVRAQLSTLYVRELYYYWWDTDSNTRTPSQRYTYTHRVNDIRHLHWQYFSIYLLFCNRLHYYMHTLTYYILSHTHTRSYLPIHAFRYNFLQTANFNSIYWQLSRRQLSLYRCKCFENKQTHSHLHISHIGYGFVVALLLVKCAGQQYCRECEKGKYLLFGYKDIRIYISLWGCYAQLSWYLFIDEFVNQNQRRPNKILIEPRENLLTESSLQYV